jgi:hypothetical protein
MSEPINIGNDLRVLNKPIDDFLDVIHTNNDWNITVWRDEGNEIHVCIADNTSGTQVDLVLGKDGYTQKC